MCLRCLPLLPRVHAEQPNNDVERRLFGRFPFEHATSFCYYGQKEPFGNIIRQSKFHDRPWLNAWATRLFVQELQLAADERGGEGWPYDIDVIVPVPLHPFRSLWRGYNQCAGIVEVLKRAWHLPLETHCLYKPHYGLHDGGSCRCPAPGGARCSRQCPNARLCKRLVIAPSKCHFSPEMPFFVPIYIFLVVRTREMSFFYVTFANL